MCVLDFIVHEVFWGFSGIIIFLFLQPIIIDILRISLSSHCKTKSRVIFWWLSILTFCLHSITFRFLDDTFQLPNLLVFLPNKLFHHLQQDIMAKINDNL